MALDLAARCAIRIVARQRAMPGDTMLHALGVGLASMIARDVNEWTAAIPRARLVAD